MIHSLSAVDGKVKCLCINWDDKKKLYNDINQLDLKENMEEVLT